MRDQAIAGVGWIGASRAGSVAIQFVTGVVLARLLTPDDFGLVAMITVLTGFVTLFADGGFAAALVQHPDLEERHRSSVLWINIAVGSALTVLTWLTAPLVSALFREPRLQPLVYLVAVNFLIVACGVVQHGTLQREMRFRSLGLIEIAGVLAGGAVGISMALAGFGVHSLICQLIAISMARVAGYWIASDWRPRPLLDLRSVAELTPFSLNQLGFSSVNYWARNADNLLIGRYVGSMGLGIYSRAYSVMLLPVHQLTAVVRQVMFPALSRIQSDHAMVRHAYLKTIRSIALITFPAMVGLFVVADDFVLGLFGPRWEAVTPILRILCLVGALQSVSATTGLLFQSQGRTDVMFRWGLVSGLIRLAAFVVAIRWGVTGVAVAYTLTALPLAAASMTIAGNLIGLRLSKVISSLSPIAAGALVMGLAVAGMARLFPQSLHPAVALTLKSLAGAALFWIQASLLGLPAYVELRDALREFLRSRGRA